jgi:hypothetical protein
MTRHIRQDNTRESNVPPDYVPPGKLVKTGQMCDLANYPSDTGRFINIQSDDDANSTHKVALIGDSTIDNGFWVQQKFSYDYSAERKIQRKDSYAQKTETVTYQIAAKLKENDNMDYIVANLAVDGATTTNLIDNGARHSMRLSKIIWDDDHPNLCVNQLESCEQFKPDTVVLSVGGNNYREPLHDEINGLLTKMAPFDFFMCQTPENKKAEIKTLFDDAKENLIKEYKGIIDDLMKQESVKRIVIVTQYYPDLSLDRQCIYTGFTHLAQANGQDDYLDYMKETMDDLYRNIYDHIQEKNNGINKEVIIADAGSSINPLDFNHTAQIEPNDHGAKLIGHLISSAITHEFEDEDHQKIPLLKLSLNSIDVEKSILNSRDNISVRQASEFMQHSRHNYFKPTIADDFLTRLSKTYNCFAGRRIDSKNHHSFGFGLLDLTIAPIIAHYLWQYSWGTENIRVFRLIAGVISAPILIIRSVVATALTIATAPLSLLFHLATLPFRNSNNQPYDELPLSTDPATSSSLAARYVGISHGEERKNAQNLNPEMTCETPGIT